jgi:hypothetical protein
MHAIAIALTAFSARATRGRTVFIAYSGLLTLAILALAGLIAKRAAEAGEVIHALALADMLAMMLVGAMLFVIAPAMVASHVVEERRSGTLDLLRTAPLSSTALTAGFLVGAPATLCLLCTGPLVLHVFAGLTGTIPLSVLALSALIVPLGAAVAMLMAMLFALSTARESGGAAPLVAVSTSAVMAVVTFVMASDVSSMPWAFVHPSGALAALYYSFDGPFRDAFSSTWRMQRIADSPAAAMQALEPVLAIFVYLAAAVLLVGAARRVLAREVSSRLTKPSALALFGLATLALALPLRVVVSPAELEVHHLAALSFALAGPYLICVLGATSSTMGARARRFSPEGAPHLTGVLMVGTVCAAVFLLYGARALDAVIERPGDAVAAAGLLLLALTVPIYARWSATCIHSGGGRLAFWALVCVHMSLQVPSIAALTHDWYFHDVPYLLAEIDVMFGVLLPLFLMRRQQLADRRAATI